LFAEGDRHDQGDTTTIAETVTAAAEELEAVATVTDDKTVVVEEGWPTRSTTATKC
jgi:exo-beta-1,3-glucanase (GH17 family)